MWKAESMLNGEVRSPRSSSSPHPPAKWVNLKHLGRKILSIHFFSALEMVGSKTEPGPWQSFAPLSVFAHGIKVNLFPAPSVVEKWGAGACLVFCISLVRGKNHLHLRAQGRRAPRPNSRHSLNWARESMNSFFGFLLQFLCCHTARNANIPPLLFRGDNIGVNGGDPERSSLCFCLVLAVE